MPAHIGAAMGGVPFHPEDIGWHSLIWAGGTEFQAEGYTHYTRLATCPDEFGGSADDGIVSPINWGSTFRVGQAAFGGEPHMYFSGNNRSVSTGDWSKADTTTVYTVVIVCWPTDWDDVHGTLFQDATDLNRLKIHTYPTVLSTWRINNTWAYLTPVQDGTNALCLKFDTSATTGQDVVSINGVTSNTNEFGVSTLKGMDIGADYGTYNEFEGGVAFVGVYDGDLRAHPDFSKLSAWCEATYGEPL